MSTHGEGSPLGFCVDVEFATLLTCGIFTFVFLTPPTRCVLEIYLDRPPPSLLILESGSPLTSIPQHWLLLISPRCDMYFGVFILSSGFSLHRSRLQNIKKRAGSRPTIHLAPPETPHHGCTHVRISPSSHHLTDASLTSSQ